MTRLFPVSFCPVSPAPGRTVLVVLLLLSGGAREAAAQRFSYGGDKAHPTQSLTFAYTDIDFTFDGEEAPALSFDFTEPAYGGVYTRPGFLFSIAFGRQAAKTTTERDRRLVDASLLAWGELNPFQRASSSTVQVFIPIALHSSYRRVTQDKSDTNLLDAFDFTVLGLGVGLGVRGEGQRWVLEARAIPIIGLAVRSFGDATGSSRMLDVDMLLHVGPLFGKFGLSIGYGYRLQRWNISASDLFPTLNDELFDYRGNQQVARVGISW